MAKSAKIPNPNPNSVADDAMKHILGIDKPKTTQYNKTVSIINMIDAKVKVTGTVTGNIYIWERAGTAQDVDIRDADEILNKQRKRACCSGNSSSPPFQLADN